MCENSIMPVIKQLHSHSFQCIKSDVVQPKTQCLQSSDSRQTSAQGQTQRVLNLLCETDSGAQTTRILTDEIRSETCCGFGAQSERYTKWIHFTGESEIAASTLAQVHFANLVATSCFSSSITWSSCNFDTLDRL